MQLLNRYRGCCVGTQDLLGAADLQFKKAGCVWSELKHTAASEAKDICSQSFEHSSVHCTSSCHTCFLILAIVRGLPNTVTFHTNTHTHTQYHTILNAHLLPHLGHGAWVAQHIFSLNVVLCSKGSGKVLSQHGIQVVGTTHVIPLHLLDLTRQSTSAYEI